MKKRDAYHQKKKLACDDSNTAVTMDTTTVKKKTQTTTAHWPVAHQDIGMVGIMSLLLAGPSIAAKSYDMYTRAMEIYNTGIFISSWGVSLASSYAILKTGSSMFMRLYSGSAANTEDLNAALGRLWNTTNQTQNHNKIENYSSKLAALGQSATSADIDRLKSAKSLSFSFLIFGSLLIYLHSMGAWEMQKKIRMRAASRSRKLNQDDGIASNNKDKMKNESLILKMTGMFFMHRKNDNENHTKNDDESIEKEKEEEDGFIQHSLRNLYESHPFYMPPTQDTVEESLFNIQNANVVRIIFNIILGIMMQLNAFWAGQSSKDPNDNNNNSSGNSDNPDPIKAITSFTSFMVYWEVLARVLRLYGWAPFYVATRQLMLLLLGTTITANPLSTNNKVKKRGSIV